MRQRTSILARVRRLTEWWRPKGGFLVSLLFFFLATYEVAFANGINLVFYSILTLTGFAIAGYVLNDWSDIASDKQVGKANSMEGLAIPLRGFVLLIALGLTAFPWLYFFEVDSFSLALIVLQLLLLTAYPVPPIRLKQFPYVALVVDALYAFAVPSVLAWHTFNLTIKEATTVAYLLFASLGVWMFSTGLRQILNHHVSDRAADSKTGTPNVAVLHQPSTIQSWIQRVLFPIELLACLFFFGSVGVTSGFFPAVVFLIAAIAGYKQLSRRRCWFNVTFDKTHLDSFASFWLGLVSAFALTAADFKYLALLVVFVLLFTDLVYHPILSVLASKLMRKSKGFLLFPFQFGSLLFNWTLYYFRKWVLGWSEERNWGEHYPKRLQDLAIQEKKRNGVVAVFNQNHNKYTETFVRGHLDSLPFHMVSFHGWPSPMHTGTMESLISEYNYAQKAKYLVWKLLNRDTSQKEDELISKRLIDENTQVILAEFGTMGNRLVEVSKSTGIPMVSVFYGYDAWHKNVLKETDYSELFEQADKLVGVSKDICNKLIVLGCPKEKVVHVPCYTNTQLFKPVDRDFSKPNILAVGRFVGTKAPHLSILAFNEVLKSIPEATLTMVGGGDDDESYENSLSLIKALGIEGKVTLKGVLSPEEVYTCMKESTLFIQHSVTTPIHGDKEGTPVAIMEALACGLPVVSTKHAGIQEVVRSGINGILVDEFDFRSMANEMVDLLQNQEKLEAISSAAIESVKNSTNIMNHSARMEEILKQAMNGT